MDGFTTASNATLHAIRGNLLHGLGLVAASLDDGSFATVGPKGAAPPSQSGQTTLALLTRVDEELAARAAHYDRS